MGTIRAKNMAINAKRFSLSLPLPALLANGTRNFSIFAVPEHPARVAATRYVLKKIYIHTPTVYASVAGTVLMNVIKRRGASTDTNLVTSFDLEVGAALAYTEVTLLGSLVLGDRTLLGGDRVRGTIVSNNADATGPVAAEAVLVVELEPVSVSGEQAFDADGNVENV